MKSVAHRLDLSNGAKFAAVMGLVLASTAIAQPQPLQPPPVPPANPITEPKRVLGKILFWDEQLSSDNTNACASCHLPNAGGSDNRRARQSGVDGLLNTQDDVFGSVGVIKSDSLENYIRDSVFGSQPQITSRSSMPAINAGYSPDLFWDGRARTTFTDPQTGQVVIPNGGGLESQAVGPPASSVEMGHAGRDWNQICGKLAGARPLALATNLPADVATALSDRPSYPALFQRAFGDGQITAARIAMAIATYERTLVANDTPWDRFVAGQANAMTQGQIQGWNFFQGSACNICHTAPLFSNNTFRNIGVRPPGEDLGRQIVTGNAADRGRFKVPSLRNAGLRQSFMHNGELTNIGQVIAFYTRAPGAAPMFNDNRDPLVPVPVPPNVAPALGDFITNALTDARVVSQTFPFDRPTLFGERQADRPALLGGGVAGTGGVTPVIIANTPPYIGNAKYKIGLDRAPAGAAVQLVASSSPPVSGRITPQRTVALLNAAADGMATAAWSIQPGIVASGQVEYFQWIVADPAAPGGQSLSGVAQVRYFCGSIGCPSACPADWDANGAATPADIAAFVNDWLAGLTSGSLRADFNASGTIDPSDIASFVNSWISAVAGGC